MGRTARPSRNADGASTHEIHECQLTMMRQLLWHRALPEQIQEMHNEKTTPRQQYQLLPWLRKAHHRQLNQERHHHHPQNPGRTPVDRDHEALRWKSRQTRIRLKRLRGAASIWAGQSVYFIFLTKAP